MAQSSQFKGWAAISKELSTRIAPKDQPLDLDEFLPSESMDDLLGTWTTFGTEHRFRNGVPNALNMTIWHVALSGFAKAVGQSCTTPRLAFHPRFIATLHKLCAWPAAEARDERVLLEFWTSVMGYNARRGRVRRLARFLPARVRQAARRGDDRRHDVRHHHESELPAAQVIGGHAELLET